MASYLGNNPDNIIRVRKGNYRYIATAAQTVFTGVDSNSLAMAVNLSDVEVFLNGVLLDQTDYTATASTITLSAGATLNDIVEVITAADFQVSNLYTKEEVDAKVSVAITDLVGTAGTALNTLGELSDALADDANYAATITTALSTKSNTTTTVTKDSSTGAATLPAGTTAQRPSSLENGMTRFNTTLTQFEIYVNGGWEVVKSIFAATGGTIINSGLYVYHTFTSSGTFQVIKGSKSVEAIIIAGGAAGGHRHAGGGGAGGAFTNISTVTTGSYSVIIGAGGAKFGASQADQLGNPGINSSFNSAIAVGGGGGGSNGQNGAAGGSGGGDGERTSTSVGGSATSGQGFPGGGTPSTDYGGGGGGGGRGGSGQAGPGNGRGGAAYSGWSEWAYATSTGVDGSYAGGGGAGGYTLAGYSAPGGGAGAGAGGGDDRSGTDATANTGSGGGGGGQAYGPTAGSGGSGIVIIRYAV